LLAAAFHAGWNFFAKLSRNTVAFIWWGVCIGALGYGGILFMSADFHLPRQAWLLYIGSIAAELGYFLALVRGYNDGDLSLVYPLSRGSAPLFTALWSALLLGERLPWMGYFGMGMIAIGIFLVSRLTSASYVVAARGTSVVIGALLGCLVLGEGYGGVRVLGSILMAWGLAFLALAN
jgi:uncharacterized membrane protein